MTHLLYDFKSLEQEFVPRKTLTLAPLLGFLQEIGSPHTQLPPTIHVAGTNGKGSTVAMLRAIYEAQGYKVHAITSPHLYCLTERLALASQPVCKTTLWQALNKYRDLAHTYHLSWYELMTGLFFSLCAQKPADILLLEVGLGGEFDGTNVIAAPLLSLITPISLDHHDFLGSDLCSIAKAKAGIIKKECPVLSAPQDPKVEKVLKSVAQENHSAFMIGTPRTAISQPNLPGCHQKNNASLVMDAITLLQHPFPVTQEAIQQGLQSIHWPGRLEKIGLVDTTQVWFDVAHNPAASKVIQHFFKTRPGHKTLLFALLKSKDPLETLVPLLETFDPIIFFKPSESNRYHPPELLQEIAHKRGKETALSPDLSHGLNRALKAIPPHLTQDILIAGSHYLGQEIQDSLQNHSSPSTGF